MCETVQALMIFAFHCVLCCVIKQTVPQLQIYTDEVLLATSTDKKMRVDIRPIGPLTKIFTALSTHGFIYSYNYRLYIGYV